MNRFHSDTSHLMVPSLTDTNNESNLAEVIPSIVVDTPVVNLASKTQVSFSGGIFMIALFGALYFMHAIAVPIAFAFVMKLVLHPFMRALQKMGIPRIPATTLILVMLIGTVGGLGVVLSTPLVSWVEKIPDALPTLQERLTLVSRPIETAQELVRNAESVTQATETKPVPVTVQGNRMSDKLLHSTGLFVEGLFTTLLVLFFLMVSGDTFLRRLVEILPRFKDKRQAVDISQQIERDISGYLLTITVINFILGCITGLIMMICGWDDPILWGSIAFLLNYIPIIGPLICFGIFLMVGLMTASTLGAAFLPAGLYMAFHVLEGNFITPHLIARRFTINPVVVVISLLFWYWMWGFAGAILAMPMLAMLKIICDRIQPLAAFGHFLEGEKMKFFSKD